MQHLIIFVLTSLVLAFWASSRRSTLPQALDGSFTMRYPRAVQGTMLVFALLGAAVTLFCTSEIGTNPTATVGIAAGFFLGMFLPFVLIFWLLSLEYHRLDAEGIRYHQLTKDGFMRWPEVTRIRHSNTMRWFVVEDVAGTSLRISWLIGGMQKFATLAKTHVPADKIDPKTAAILADAAVGILPRIMA